MRRIVLLIPFIIFMVFWIFIDSIRFIGQQYIEGTFMILIIWMGFNFVEWLALYFSGSDNDW